MNQDGAKPFPLISAIHRQTTDHGDWKHVWRIESYTAEMQKQAITHNTIETLRFVDKTHRHTPFRDCSKSKNQYHPIIN